MKSLQGVIVSAALAAGLVSFAPSQAEACGGFFCDGQQPVNQAAERIIFSDNPDGTVTAVVQILYQGPSSEFAWVLPVPSVPDIAVSSNLAFQRLQSATNPQYVLNSRVEGNCAVERSQNNANSSNSFNGVNNDFSVDAGSEGPPVSVVDQGSVGPYDYVVIEVDDQLPDPAQSAVDWLETNGYDVTALGPEVMRPYIEDGMFLLAFRLTKQADSGDIRPVSLTYQTDVPMIPIKLTAVAANDDMGVLVWVMGEERAVPINYKSLEINDALINWFNPMPTYNQVVTAAADEAMGQGFVTEFAGAGEIADEVVFTRFDEQQWEVFGSTDWSSNTDSLVIRAWETYAAGSGGVWDGWPETVNGFFGGLTPEERSEIVQCAACVPELIPDGIDASAFIAELEENIVTPMRDTQALLESLPYMTRLYTTMSAAEMTVDPVFEFNPDLSDQSRRHEAMRVIECSSRYYQWEAPWRVELPSGNVVRGQGGGGWPFTPGGMLPANQLILQDSTEGEADVVEDNTMTIQQGIEAANAALNVRPGSASPDRDDYDPDNPGATFDDDASVGGSGCSTGGGAASLLALLGFIGLRRRREDA